MSTELWDGVGSGQVSLYLGHAFNVQGVPGVMEQSSTTYTVY